MQARQIHDRLLDAILAFVRGETAPAFDPFRAGLDAWGSRWRPAPARDLPASAYLHASDLCVAERAVELFAAFRESSNRLRWEQSYQRADGLVGEDMLAGYGFAEIIGKHGPFVSEHVRSGIGVWGPRIVYPTHWHQPEELYYVVAGSAEFKIGDDQYRIHVPGDAVHVAPGVAHGLRTVDEPLVVFCLWHGGDMRETSAFGERAS